MRQTELSGAFINASSPPYMLILTAARGREPVVRDGRTVLGSSLTRTLTDTDTTPLPPTPLADRRPPVGGNMGFLRHDAIVGRPLASLEQNPAYGTARSNDLQVKLGIIALANRDVTAVCKGDDPFWRLSAISNSKKLTAEG
jgi:hypothetical protein